VAELSAILEFVHVEAEEINGLRGPHVIIEGANLHVRSGSGLTGFPACPGGQNCPTAPGLGNLVVGYNELPPSPTFPRRGMHNLIVGPEHEYIGTGGIVAGRHNLIRDPGASVTGGKDNQAINAYSSVSGGIGNVASGFGASVSGGQNRDAPGSFNWAAGSLLEFD